MQTTTNEIGSLDVVAPLAPEPANPEAGIIGWAIMWWLGVPFTVLLLAWLLFFR